MPYRDQATVDTWLREFLDANEDLAIDISVLEQDFTAGPQSGLVVVRLRGASTMTYVQPIIQGGSPQWVVTFEGRPESFDLDADGVARLAEDLAIVARICRYLQDQTDDVVAGRRTANA